MGLLCFLVSSLRTEASFSKIKKTNKGIPVKKSLQKERL
jgi:hypothetical protein